MSGTTEQTQRPVALVTGGTGGIGASICRVLARDGHDIVFTYHSKTEKAKAVVAELEEIGTAARAEKVDLTDAEATRDLVVRSTEALGPLTTVVHASGPYVDQVYVSNVGPEKFALHIEQELIAFFNLVHATLPELRATRGTLTAVTSTAVRRFPVKDILSGAPKGGIEVLVRAVAREEGKFGVRANSVAPGVIEDAMGMALMSSGDFDPTSIEMARTLTPLGRFGLSLEVAEVVAFLASGHASYVSGQTIDVDGGYTA